MDVDVDVDAGTEDVLAHVARGVGLLEGLLQDLDAFVELAPDVDVGRLGRIACAETTVASIS